MHLKKENQTVNLLLGLNATGGVLSRTLKERTKEFSKMSGILFFWLQTCEVQRLSLSSFEFVHVIPSCEVFIIIKRRAELGA